ncbi:MAG: short-chain dehydrogenase [Gammaproteobacteria bacterium]|nr:short-chain dehydrogenase [Gammaproteobacteria bacterium]
MSLILITGASKGIGKAAASQFINNGDEVINISRTPSDLKGVRNISLDLSAEDAPEQVAEFAEGISNQEIHLIHNAALLISDQIASLETKQFKAVVSLNVIAPQILNLCLLPKMNRGSSIIYIGSTLSEKAVKNSFSYVTSKHAVVGMMRATCQDLAGRNIHTACICPGFTNTEMLREHVGGSEEALEMVGNLSAYGRLVEPEEIAETIRFVSKSPALNGTIIHANLGQIES